MRRFISAILILLVFLSLQFGKIATYLYCTWQMELVQNRPDCGCETHLTDMFDHGDTGTDGNISKVILKEKITEDSPRIFFTGIPKATSPLRISFTHFDSPLLNCFIAPPFHPPAA